MKDKKCSRQQIELKADYSTQEVRVTQKGANSSLVADSLLAKGEERVIGSGAAIELVPGGERFWVFYEESSFDSVDSQTTDKKLESIKECPHSPEEDEPPAKRSRPNSHKAISKASKQSSMLQFIASKAFEKEQDPSNGSHMTGTWEWINTVKMYRYGNQSKSKKIAIFDLDYTLISTQSGRKFPKDEHDWRWLMPSVAPKVRGLYEQDGFRIAVLSNQSGLKKKDKERQFEVKLKAVCEALAVPVVVLASSTDDKYRKPLAGMWEALVEQARKEEMEISLHDSFYVGDAAGRPDNWAPGKKKDFSCSDRKFAFNVGLKFYTPEEYFLSQSPAKFSWGEFDPQEFFKSPLPLLQNNQTQLTASEKEVIVFVGCPASGKSNFCSHHLPSYVHISRDKLGTWQKCVNACYQAIKEGKSVAIDNTNPDAESRQRYIQAAKKMEVPVRCFWVTTSLPHAKHNNKFRELINSDTSYKPVPDLAFNVYKSKFSEPTVEEGFHEIVRVNFVANFKSDFEEKLYMMHLT